MPVLPTIPCGWLPASWVARVNWLLTRHRRLVDGPPWKGIDRLLLVILAPLSWLYGWIARVRIGLYAAGLFKVYRAPVPVISVGNLAAGGTGKTPVVDYIARYLLDQGRRVAIVSRGYGGENHPGVQLVCAGKGPLLAPGQVGDEPYLLARRNPRALVLTARRRAEGVRKAVAELAAEVVLLDDGFQHRAVARDLDIVLLDARRPLGNGLPLPAGHLREFPAALGRGHLFILTRVPQSPVAALKLPGPVLHSRHQLSQSLLGSDGSSLPFGDLIGKKGLAFAGIADPPGFFAACRQRGLTLGKTLSFADHCRYNAEDLEQLRRAAAEVDYLITTEKDGVKLGDLAFDVPCYQWPLSLEFVEVGALEQHLESLLKTGEGHGPVPRTP